MTLYLKYRPQTLGELDPENVRESLKKIVASRAIPHAFLFSGPKGTGKTSAARILAKIVNCENPPAGGEPCNKCYQCTSITKGENLDVVELDAASHRGIDDVRALRDAVKLASAQAKMKVYVIDEAHMLTTEASNALLKTLEEPPAHVMFILATTNPEKLVETIRSRTTNIVFKKATPAELVRSLTKIVKGEKIKVEEGVLDAIAKASEASFRDAAKILEQLIIEGKKLEVKSVEEFLFQRKAFSVEKFLLILAKRDTKEALQEIEVAQGSGVTVRNMTDAIIERLRNALLAKVGLEGEDLANFSKDEVVLLIKLLSRAVREIPDAVLEQIPLEIAVVEWCEDKLKNQNSTHSINSGPSALSSEPKRLMQNEVEASKIKIEEDKTPAAGFVPQDKFEEKEESEKIKLEMVEIKKNGVSEQVWARILTEIRPKNTSTEALLRAAKPVDYDGKTLTLGVYYRFHKERLEGHPHKILLEDAVAAVFGNPVRIVCTLATPPEKPQPKEEQISTTSDTVLTEGEDADIIKVAKEIFGS